MTGVGTPQLSESMRKTETSAAHSRPENDIWELLARFFRHPITTIGW